MFQIFVKLCTGRTVILIVDECHTVEHLKRMIHDVEAIPVVHQRLVFSGKELENDETLKSIQIGNNSNMHLFLRLRNTEVSELYS